MFHTHYRVPPAKLPPGTYRNITGNEATALGFVAASQAGRPRAVLRLVPDHAGQRHPPPAVRLQELRRQDVPGGGRDRRHRLGDRRELRRRDGHDGDVRPGHRAQERGARPRGDGRAAAGGGRRPARRTVDRHADQDRAGRPAAGHVRAQLRLAGRRSSPRRRPANASTTRSRRAARAQVHDAGRVHVGRVPRHRRRAVADPVGRRPARIAVSNATKGDGPFQPYPRDPETLARPWAVPGTPGLEHRIGGLEKADITGNVSYDPDNHHRMQLLRQAKIAGIADGHPAAGGLRARRAATCWSSAGARRTARSGQPSSGSRPRAKRRPRPPAPPQPVPREHRGRSCGATARCSSRRSTSASCCCCSARAS